LSFIGLTSFGECCGLIVHLRTWRRHDAIQEGLLSLILPYTNAERGRLPRILRTFSDQVNVLP